MEMTEERVCKLEDRAIEMIQSEEQREKKKIEKKQSTDPTTYGSISKF